MAATTEAVMEEVGFVVEEMEAAARAAATAAAGAEWRRTRTGS